MAEQPKGTAEQQAHALALVGRLVTAADGDTLYRDVYLRRAGEILAPLIGEAHYEATLTAREQLDRLLAQARAAVGRQDWTQVRELGTRAADLQRSLDAEKDLVAAAETVYGAPVVMLDPLSPGLPHSRRWPTAEQARTEVAAVLAELARDEPTARELYAARGQALAALSLPGAVSTGAAKGAGPATSVEQQALHAIERGDAASLTGLADAMLGTAKASASASAEGAPATRGRIAVPEVLGTPLPDACLARAKTLGLEAVEVTLSSPAMATTIADFVERYAVGASAAALDRARDGVARVTLAAEEVSVPKELASLLGETVSLFALNLYVNSAGLRYVPLPATREMLLVETHPDGEEAVTPLLQQLELDRRRGLARDEVELRLHKHGARVVAEQLGLDPLAFRIVCVPADVFMRVGDSRGWGKRPEWTHFDGYQVMANGRLRALMGGNARFGGLFDLCSISRDDARENTVVRLAVVRRERLGVRIA